MSSCVKFIIQFTELIGAGDGIIGDAAGGNTSPNVRKLTMPVREAGSFIRDHTLI